MELLTKTRKINTLLQKSSGISGDFKEMAGALCDVIDANIFIVDRHGHLLNFSICQLIENDRMTNMLKERQFPKEYSTLLSNLNQTTSNIDINSEYTVFPVENKKLFSTGLTTIVPIVGGGERLGTLILARVGASFVTDDLFLAEYGATVVGMEILRKQNEEKAKEARNKAIVQVAIRSLSYSELEAVETIFDELGGKEGLLVASKLADRTRITRSVIVNALRKLESARVIESRSLGMKGTYIKVLNDRFITELENIKATSWTASRVMRA